MTKRDSYDTIGPELLKALSHPLRQKILEVLNQRVASPAEISVELSEHLGNVSYHIKVLEQRGAIELVKTEPVRGAIEHFYRALVRPRIEDPDHWASLPVSIRRKLFDHNLQHIWNELVSAAQAEGLDDSETHISWTDLELDEQARAELGELLAEVVGRALELHAESAGRLGKLPAEERGSIKTELAIVHFQRDGKKPARSRRRRARTAKATS